MFYVESGADCSFNITEALTSLSLIWKSFANKIEIYTDIENTLYELKSASQVCNEVAVILIRHAIDSRHSTVISSNKHNNTNSRTKRTDWQFKIWSWSWMFLQMMMRFPLNFHCFCFVLFGLFLCSYHIFYKLCKTQTINKLQLKLLQHHNCCCSSFACFFFFGVCFSFPFFFFCNFNRWTFVCIVVLLLQPKLLFFSNFSIYPFCCCCRHKVLVTFVL